MAPQPQRRSGRWLIPSLIGGVLAVVLLIGGGVVVYKRASGDDKPTGNAGGATKIPGVERPGYPTPGPEEGIVDPYPLTEKNDAPPVTVGGAPVIPACSLLTLADLKQAGMRLKPNQAKGVYQRTFFDGKGTGALEDGGDYLLPVSPFNNCRYVVEEGSVEVQVFQESYTNPKGMTDGVDNYQPQPAIKGVTVTKQPPTTKSGNPGDDYAVFALRLRKTLVQVTLLTHNNKMVEVQPKILDTVAGKLLTASTKPAGNPVVDFNSPAFPMSALDACSVLLPEDFQAMANTAAAPFVTEEVGTAVGRLNFSINTKNPDANEYAYVERSCQRSTGAEASTDRVALLLEVRSYTSDKPAGHDIAFSQPYDEGKPISRTVGDGSYCVISPQGHRPGALIFRTGRYLMTLTFIEPKKPAGGQNALSIAGRCRGPRRHRPRTVQPLSRPSNDLERDRHQRRSRAPSVRPDTGSVCFVRARSASTLRCAPAIGVGPARPSLRNAARHLTTARPCFIPPRDSCVTTFPRRPTRPR
jgi:hypothetical protein